MNNDELNIIIVWIHIDEVCIVQAHAVASYHLTTNCIGADEVEVGTSIFRCIRRPVEASHLSHLTVVFERVSMLGDSDNHRLDWQDGECTHLGGDCVVIQERTLIQFIGEAIVGRTHDGTRASHIESSALTLGKAIT